MIAIVASPYASTAHNRWMISSIWCYHSTRLDCSRPILLLAGWSLPAGLRLCCCIVNVTLFSRVTLIRKLQSTSDLDHFHARHLPCSRVKSRNDPISGRPRDIAVPYSFIYRDFVFSFTRQSAVLWFPYVGCFSCTIGSAPFPCQKSCDATKPGFSFVCCSIFVFRMNVCFSCIRFSFFSTCQEIG